jgi:hypothetical protein
MINSEAALEQAHDPNIVENALRNRPVMPLGDLAILTCLAHETEQQLETPYGYAWTRLAVWLISRDSYREVDADAIVRLSNCSSVPYEAALAMGEEFNRRGRKASEIVRSLLSETSMQPLKTSEDTQELLPLAVALTKHSKGKNARFDPTSSLARDLLVAAVHRTIYEITLDEFNDIEKLKIRLRDTMSSQRYMYIQDLDFGDIESSWGVRYEYKDAGQTYLDAVSSLGVPSPAALQARRQLRTDAQNVSLREAARETVPAGDELAQKYIEWQVGKAAALIFGSPQLRPYRSLSMDIAPPDTILEGSLANLPPSLVGSNIIPHAFASLYNEQQHLRGDTYKPIPAPDGSLALITNIDGMPYHSSPAHTEAEVSRFKERNIAMLVDGYAKLAPGAELVIFPWDVANGGPEQLQVLDEIVYEFGNLIRNSVDRRVFHLSTLKDWMSDADRQIAEELSPIFRSGRHHFEALIIRKPREPVEDYSAIFNKPMIALLYQGNGEAAGSVQDESEAAAHDPVAYRISVVDKLYSLYENAKFGDEVVICPWEVTDGNPDQRRAIDEVAVELARRVHHGIDIRIYPGSCFSNPATEEKYFLTIAFTKPRESLVDVHNRALKKADRESKP